MAIYKYVSEFRIDILENGLIRYTQPSIFNDPFEVYPYFKAIADDKAVDNFIKGNWIEENIERKIEQLCKEKLRPYSSLMDNLNIKEKVNDQIKPLLPSAKLFLDGTLRLNSPEYRAFILSVIRKALDETIGLLCFTESPINLVMWAHYANLHKGFVIEFDERHKYFDRREKPKELRRCLRKVNYSEKRPEIILFNLNLSNSENIDTWINKFFWNKSNVWEYEQEWRMIETLKECKNRVRNGREEICLFPVPLDSITGIILGCKASLELQERFTALLKSDKRYSHINLKHSTIDEKDFKLNII